MQLLPALNIKPHEVLELLLLLRLEVRIASTHVGQGRLDLDAFDELSQGNHLIDLRFRTDHRRMIAFVVEPDWLLE